MKTYPQKPLSAYDFVRIASEGFGDPENNRVQCMAWFKGKLYAGISRRKIVREVQSGSQRPGTGRSIGAGTSYRHRYLDQPGQIWSYDPNLDQWQRVFVSPVVNTPQGESLVRESGYRRMVALQGASDRTLTLYVFTLSVLGSRILRSEDGEHFELLPEGGLKDIEAWSFRGVALFKDCLHISPAGRIGTEFIERNITHWPAVFSNPDPGKAPWMQTSEVGFGDSANVAVYSLATFNECLYAGTFNPQRGYQVWKTRSLRYPYQWREIITDGAYRGSVNQAVASMCVFRDALYIGTGREGNPAKMNARISEGAELIRIYPDDSWDLLIGEPRSTFDGQKYPLSDMGPGFDRGYNGVIWTMAEHKGWLYAGTENKFSLLPLLHHHSQEPKTKQWLRTMSSRISEKAGFNLWRSRDGKRWALVTEVGFGNPCNLGLESLVSTPVGLFAGTVSLADLDGQFSNRRRLNGCEVWLGSR